MHHLRSLLAFSLVGVIVGVGDAQTASSQSAKFRPRNPAATSDRYIVVLDASTHEDNVAAIAASLTTKHKGKARHLYKKAFKGFAAHMSAADAKALSADPRVVFVEEDTIVSVSTIQSSPDWGLDRIDQRKLPLNDSYHYDADGSGVHLYIIDSGVRITHTEFGPAGRATLDYSAYGGTTGATDCNGHGTSVASLAAGQTAGVAKKAFVHSVRVLGCDGTGYWSDAINGIDWVTANHKKPAVANMSIGGARSDALTLAVQGALDAGVTFVAAAGNNSADACVFAAGSIESALIVGNSDQADRREYTSNAGSCLDLWAPGTSIRAARFSGDADYHYTTGTSLSAPFVAGAAALYLQRTPAADPSEVTEAVVNTATPGVLLDIGTGSPNLALYTPALGDRTPPTVALTAPAAGTSVNGIVTVTATATDNLGVDSVEFFVGATLIATDATAPYSAKWVTDTLAPGSYTLTAVAIDVGGNVKTSAARTVAVAGATAVRDAFAGLEAESYDAMSGVVKSGSYVGYVDGGDWVKFSAVDFGAGASSVKVRLAVAESFAGKQIQFRLGSPTGTAIGTLTVASTGGWTTFATQSATISGANSVRDLYLTFSGGAGVGNIDALTFTAASSSPPPESGELSVTGWTASSSSTYSPASRAIDRNTAYKWQNGRSQATSNDHIQIDLGSARTFNRVVLEHTGHVNDYPVAYKVEVSSDATNWTVARTGSGTPSATSIALPSSYTKRYIRITETGSTGGNWFTVNELRVFSDTGAATSGGELVPSTWKASASSAYSPASRAIDRNAAYRWQNGRSQATSNDYIQVDLGSAKPFTRIALDHTGSINDFPTAYKVELSDDGSSWQTVKTGIGTQTATTIQLPARYTKRFIRITETGTSGTRWFSVNELRVFDE
jgi:hypothetical protein